MPFRKESGSGGIVLIFVVSMLALLSVVAVTFVQMSSQEQTLGRNFTYAAQARLAAESGIAYAQAQLRNLGGGPVPEAVLHDWGCDFGAPDADAENENWRTGMRRPLNPSAAPDGPLDAASVSAGLQVTHTTTIRCENGKLNINDPNSPLRTVADDEAESDAFGDGRLVGTLAAVAGIVLEEEARGRQVARDVILNPEYGRAAFAGDRFPDMAAVTAALRGAGLNTQEARRLRDMLTVYSWRDPDVLHPTLEICGSWTQRGLYYRDAARGQFYAPFEVLGVDLESGEGGYLTDFLGMAVETNLAIQGRNFELEARAPVNINVAPLELLQALLQPIRGFYLEEGPPEHQSSEHYGWWATGLGEPDAVALKKGTLRLTEAFTPAQATRLARALYDRIHGPAWNSDIDNDWAVRHAVIDPGGTVDWDDQQPDADGDGDPDPNPFETWEEFRHFLEEGLTEEAQNAIFLPEGFSLPADFGMPTPYDTAHGYVDPFATYPNPAALAAMDTTDRREFNYNAAYAKQLSFLPLSNFQPVANPLDLEWWQRYYRRFQRDAVLANANPNALMNDFNPNANVYLAVDKNQLYRHTTEFCFQAGTAFSITARGEVADGDELLLARADLNVVIRPFEMFRLTSQAQFLRGVTDASAHLDRHFTRPYLGAGMNGFQPHDATSIHTKYTLQSYPEPVLPGKESWLAEARYDGYLMLANLERVMTSAQGLRFIGSYNGDSANPLQGDLWSNPGGEMSGTCLTSALTSPPWGPASIPGAVYPDGAYCEPDRCLAYSMRVFASNGNPQEGTVQFWIKPNFHPGISTRIRKFLAGPAEPGVFANRQALALYYFANPSTRRVSAGNINGVNFTNNWKGYMYEMQRPDWCSTRSFAFGGSWTTMPATAGALSIFDVYRLQTGSVTNDFPGANHGWPTRFEGRQWNHIAAGWTRRTSAAPGANPNPLPMQHREMLYLNSVKIYGGGGYATQGYATSTNSSAAADPGYTTINLPANAAFSIGELNRFGMGGGRNPYAADATVDELQCYLYGVHQLNTQPPGSGETLLPESKLSWNQGRYFHNPEQGFAPNETAPRGTYYSPALELKTCLPGVRGRLKLQSCAWTYYRPAQNRKYNMLLDGPNKHSDDNLLGIAVNPNDRLDPMIPFWNSRLPDARYLEPRDLHAARRWDPVGVEVLLPDGQMSNQFTEELTYPGGSQLPDSLPAYLRWYEMDDVFYAAVHLYLKHGQRLYESPVIDDVTFVFQRQVPEILALTTGGAEE